MGLSKQQEYDRAVEMGQPAEARVFCELRRGYRVGNRFWFHMGEQIVFVDADDPGLKLKLVAY